MDELLQALFDLFKPIVDESTVNGRRIWKIFRMDSESQIRGLRAQDLPAVMWWPEGGRTFSGPFANGQTHEMIIRVRALSKSVDPKKYREPQNFWNVFRTIDFARSLINGSKNLGVENTPDNFVYAKEVDEQFSDRSNGAWQARDFTFTMRRFETFNGQRNNDAGLNIPDPTQYQYAR